MALLTKRTRWLVLLALVAAAAGACFLLPGGVNPWGHGAARSQAAPAPAAAPEPPAEVPVTVAPVTPRPVRRSVQIVGTFYGHEEVAITPKVEGRVAKILYDVGDVVKPGDVLLEIEDVDYRLAAAEAERALEMEVSKLGLSQLPPGDLDLRKVPTVVRAEYQEKHAQAKFNRTQRLRGTAANAQEEYEQAQTEYSVAQATHRQMIVEAKTTLATVRHRQAVLETAKQKLAETRVRVPHLSEERLRDARGLNSGRAVEYVVAQRMASEGEMVRAFPSTAVFRLVMDQPLKLMATVPERHVGGVKVGQPVEIRVEAYPEQVFKGAVSRVNPTVDRANRTFQIEVLVPNESRQLKAGSFAKASVFTREDPQCLTVPEEALVTFAGVTKVFVVQDGKARTVKVRPGVRLEVPAGERTEHWIEVLGKLPADGLVVTSGQSQLAEGTAVRVRGQTMNEER